MDISKIATFFLLVIIGFVNTKLVLFPEPGTYVYSFIATVSTGTVLPKELISSYSLKGVLRVQSVQAPYAFIFKLSSLKHTLLNGQVVHHADENYKSLSSQAKILERPYLVRYLNEGIVEALNFTKEEPLWSRNIKKAITANLQMQLVERPFLGAYKHNEPCIHGICSVEYSSTDGAKIRKSNSIPTSLPSATHDLWVNVMPNLCTKNTKNPLVGTSNRWYTVDNKGLLNLQSDGDIQVHYHHHIFRSFTNITLVRIKANKDLADPKESFPIQTGVAYQSPNRSEPTGGRSPMDPSRQLEYLEEILGRLADGLEAAGFTDTLLKDKLPLNLQKIMSTLSYETLTLAYEELELGTSYKWETMKNIFLEVLPQAKSKASILLVRDLIVNKKIYDETTILHLLRKMPFNIADISEDLLKDMEPLLKLNLDYSKDIRHTAILSFSTLVFKAFINGACSNDLFENYVQMYFSRYSESPDYIDRLVWLSGLSNLQLEHVTTYLAPIISGKMGHSPNERFLAVWATMPLAHLYPTEVHNIYWPILHNETEPLEMRVAAVTMLVLGEPSAHRLLSLYWYIASQSSDHLTNYFYTTIKSLESTTFDCYKHIAKVASYLSKMIKKPINQTKLWATGNHLFDFADAGRDFGFMFQSVLIANPLTGLPDIFYGTLISHNAGLIVQDYAIYIKMQGVVNNFLGKIYNMNADSLRIPELIAALQQLKVQPQPIQPVHFELLLKYQGKIIYALHINQTTFNKWTEGDIKKTIDSILQAESHINQQILIYPTIMKSSLPSELGTPIITDTILSTLTSIRGNLTYSMKNEELTRKNDVHLRTSTLALIGLGAYNPIADTYHIGEVAQVSDAYFPANFTVGLSLIGRKLRTTWLNPGNGQLPGFVAYSGARVAVVSHDDIGFNSYCPGCQQEMFTSGDKLIMSHLPGIEFECNGPTSPTELLWQILTSHKSNANVFPVAKPLLILLHTMALGGIPADGPCKLAVSTTNYPNIPHKIDGEIAFIPNTDNPDKLQFKIWVVTRSDDKKNQILSSFNTTTSIEYNDNKIKMAVKAIGKNSPATNEWKVCLDVEEKYNKDTEIQDLDMRDRLTSGHVVMAVGPLVNKCPTNGTVISIYLKPNYSNRTVGQYDIQLKIKNVMYKMDISNQHFGGHVRIMQSFFMPKMTAQCRCVRQLVPEEISSTFLKYRNAMDILGSKPIFFAYDLAKLVTNELSKSSAVINGSIISVKNYRKLIFQGENSMAVNVWAEDENSCFLNSNGQMNFLKEIGIIKECHIKAENMIDVHGKDVSLSSTKKCELLAIADCTSSPKYAIVKIPSPHGLAIRFYIGGNYAEVQPTATDELNVSVNNKHVNWQPSYQFPEHEPFYDFKISGSGDKLTIESKITVLKVIYRKQDVIISLPTTHLSLSCGACTNSKTLHTKC